MINGHEHLYGRDDYESNYSEGEPLRALHQVLWYRCVGDMLDAQREYAKALDKLPARDPLPYISRRALARVKDKVDAPTACPYCAGKVDLVSNSEIYRGTEYGDWPYAYLCRGCGAYVGLHPSTDIPLGTLADKETREARKTAKEPFFHLARKRFGGDRSAAYQWLAGRMDIPASQCHFGMFSADQCAKALSIIEHAVTGRVKP